MKESSFVKKNLDSWKTYEKIIDNKEEKPLNLSHLFVKITDDLSYAYTYYKNRSVRLYLNGVAKRLYQGVNNSESFRLASVKKYFIQTVPLAIHQARYEFYISFAIFTLAFIIGVFSSKYDPEFAQLILGQDYIEMTQKNISENDPMAVYKSQAPFDMFFAITLNNTLVAVKTFVAGLFMAIGSVFIMIYNGIMVGAFQYFFIEQGLFKTSFLTIWQHGVLEISSIIMAGAAGLVLGKGLVFPGNFTRFQSLRISARKGLKLMLGIIPILVIAGFIEGFYTRFTSAPDALRILTILISLAFIISYFILLPRYQSRRVNYNPDIANNIEATSPNEINLNEIHSGSELFMLTFQQIKIKLSAISKIVLAIALFTPFALLFLSKYSKSELLNDQAAFSILSVFYQYKLGILILLVSFSLTLTFLSRLQSKKNETKHLFFTLQTLPILCLTHAALFIPNTFFAFALFTIMLFISILILTVIYNENVNFITAISTALKYLKGSLAKFIFLCFRFLILGILFYLTFEFVIDYLNDFVQMNLFGSDENKYRMLFYFDAYYSAVVILFISAISFVGINLLYFSLYESFHAKSLMNKITNIGQTKRIKGLLRE